MSAIKRQYYREMDKDPYYQYECDRRDIDWWRTIDDEMKSGLKNTDKPMINSIKEKVA